MSPTTPSVAAVRRPLVVTYFGLGLTVAAVMLVYVDHLTANVLAAHIQDGYPSYSRSRINRAAMTYLVYLSVVGVLGIVGWLTTLWAVARRKSWARLLAAGLLVAGTSVALFNLLIRDTSGDTGLPALLGWTGLLPSIAGLVVVIMLWRRTDS